MENLPQELKQLVESENYVEAIAKCPSFGVSPDVIQEYVRKRVKDATKAFSTDPDKAIRIYMSLIGVVEPSVVLCRFFAPHLSNYLARYLIELHKRGYAGTQHTKLLFNLFHHANNRPLLQQFIEMLQLGKEQQEQPAPKAESFSFFKNTNKRKEPSYVKLIQTFDATAAIETLRQNDMDDDALKISELMNISTHKIALMIESTHSYIDAARAIEEKAEESSGFSMLMEFGPRLLSLPPSDDAELVTHIIENTAIRIWSTPSPEKGPEPFFKLFWGHPRSALNVLQKITRTNNNELFLDFLIMLRIPIRKPQNSQKMQNSQNPQNSQKMQNPQKEQNLQNDQNESELFFGNPAVVNEKEALSLLGTKPLGNIDQLLFYCTEVGFTEGVVALLVKKKRFAEVTAMLIDAGDEKKLAEWYNEHETTLQSDELLNIFHFFVKRDKPDEEILTRIVSKIVASNAAPLASLLDELCTNPNIPFAVAQGLFEGQSSEISLKLQDEEAEHTELTEELARLEDRVAALEQSDFEFKPMTCDLCKQELDSPSIGFFCRHNFHKRCAENDGNGHFFCPLCHAAETPEYKVPEEGRVPMMQFDQHHVIEQAVTLVENGFFL